MRVAECRQQTKIEINELSDCNNAHSSSDSIINKIESEEIIDDSENNEKFIEQNQEEERYKIYLFFLTTSISLSFSLCIYLIFCLSLSRFHWNCTHRVRYFFQTLRGF